ncbi:hypothetical protein [Beijerinckia mobilis]|uniref:hypothetical protein n=1 Tax=Beijerinckia mobilis TaxID=231434 RepID=UPI0005550BD0|nr:hypothetical protein [Beijerinckia mobilis]
MSQIVLYSGRDQADVSPIYLHVDDDLQGYRLRIVPSAGTGLHVHIERDKAGKTGLFRKQGGNETANVGENHWFVPHSKLAALLIVVAGMSISWIGINVAKTIAQKADVEHVGKAPAANYVQSLPEEPAYQIREKTAVPTFEPDAQLKAVTDNLRHAPVVTPAPGSDPKSPSGPAAFGLE